ncbi:endonuclease/exonuclease/phosphatase family protein, partial [Trifolium medium]|nr:endonuclease/exonuclease/phosphatase family protein [Trifolium medium]
ILSEAFPIVVYVDEENWGPKPFRMLKRWTELLGYRKFVIEKWRSYNVFGWGRNIVGRITEAKGRRNDLDVKGEEFGRSEEEREELRFLSSQFFHGVMSNRKRGNAIHNLVVEGAQLEGLVEIHNVVYNHFEQHFQAPIVDRPRIDNLQF